MGSRTVAPLLLTVVAAVGLTGCTAPPDPVAAVAIGSTGSGYMGIVRLCDEGRTFTRVAFAGPDESAEDAAISWIGRSVEPVTFFRVGEDPPDNFVVQTSGPVANDVEYAVKVQGDDLDLDSATADVFELVQLGGGAVLATDGTELSVAEFLESACD